MTNLITNKQPVQRLPLLPDDVLDVPVQRGTVCGIRTCRFCIAPCLQQSVGLQTRTLRNRCNKRQYHGHVALEQNTFAAAAVLGGTVQRCGVVRQLTTE